MLTEFLSIGMNNCLQCGSFGFRPSQLCSCCESNLFKSALNVDFFISEVRGISCLGLLRWQKDRNRILNRLSVGLKGTRQGQAWDYYAERFLSEWLKKEVPSKNAIFVPCPARDSFRDHAYLFAESLARLTGIELVPLLELVDVKEQKRLGRKERESGSKYRFRINKLASEKFSMNRAKTVYFVDDIITTGATIQAARSALKDWGHVKAISLIIRE